MFYIREYLRFFKNNLVGQFFFSLLTVSLIVTVSNYNALKTKISQSLPSVENEYYFNALVDGKLNISSISRKIEGLPGVKEVMNVDSSKTLNITNQMSKILDLDKSEIGSVLAMKGVKVVLDEKVSESSTNLIREYLVRLSGKGNVVLGNVRKKITNHQSWKEVVFQLKKRPVQALILVLFTFWALAFFVIRRNTQQISYLIERYQRKSKVAFKLYSTNILISCLVGVGISSLAFNADQVLMLCIIGFIALSSSIFLIGKSEWQKA